jgi:hypothetical protein
MAKKISPSVLVEGARKMLDDGWGYIWGAYGQIWTQADQDRVKADPDGRAQTKEYGQKWVGHHVIDCSGIPYKIAKDNGISIAHGSNTQYLKYCDKKGKIENGVTLVPGVGVFKYSDKYKNPYYHVGIYEGNGKVIEAQGTYRGVIRSSLFGWTHYGYWKFVDWADAGGDKIVETLRKGSKGPAVSALQEMLNKLGYNSGAVDGVFGSKTEAAVKNFQKDNRLTADGLAGERTMEILAIKASVAPAIPPDVTDDVVTVKFPRTVFDALKDILNRS